MRKQCFAIQPQMADIKRQSNPEALGESYASRYSDTQGKAGSGRSSRAGVLLQYRDCLNASGRRVEAQVIYAEVDRITSQSGTFCPSCTVNVNSLSKTLR
jgi:hypothetical protein